MTANEIIDGALAILSSPDRFSNNWLTDEDGRLVPHYAGPGRGRRTCVDGALKLAALGLTPETATLSQAHEGPAFDRAELNAAKNRVLRAAFVAGLISLNERGYDAVIAALREARGSD